MFNYRNIKVSYQFSFLSLPEFIDYKPFLSNKSLGKKCKGVKKWSELNTKICIATQLDF